MKQFIPNNLSEIIRCYFPNFKDFSVITSLKDNIQLIDIDGQKYILKFYSNSIDRLRITFFEKLQNFTSDYLNISPKILSNTKNELNFVLGDSIFELYEYTESIEFDDKKVVVVEDFYYDVGNFLGKLHNAFSEYSKTTSDIFKSELHLYENSANEMNQLLSLYKEKNIGSPWKNILEEKIAIASSTVLDTNTLSALPRGIVHGDFYPKNILFDDQMQIIGLIDYAQAGDFIRCYEVIRALVQTTKYLHQIDIDPINLKSFLQGYLKNSPLQQVELDNMLDLFIYIQASDIFFNSIATITGNDKGLQDYAQFRYQNLISLSKNRQLLNKNIHEI